MGRGRATADVLPECVIQKILCFLSYEEASRLRIISKTWLQAWFTLPNLKFRVGTSEQRMRIVDKFMERYRDGNISIGKFQFHISTDRGGDLFPLIDKWLDIAFQNGVKDLEFIYTNTRTLGILPPFPIFKFLTAKSLRELVLRGCDLMHLSLSSTSHVVNCHSLRKLSLSGVRLNDNMLQTLFTSCPLIVNLMIEHCIGVTNIELRNLHKIMSLTIIVRELVKIQAPTLEHLSYSSHSLEELDIVEYHNLKSLEISCTEISHSFIERLISRPHFLESLKLVNISFGRFICRSQSLRVLKIQNCEITGAIDAPNLVLFEYKGRVIPQVTFAKESSQLKDSQIFLDCRYKLDAAWFCQLRNFLSNSTSWSQVSLGIYKCNEISRNHLQVHHRVGTPQVDVLDVSIFGGDCPTFPNALLWSCHPRRLNLSSTVKMITCFIKCFMYMKNSNHSTSQLEEVKAYKFDLVNESWHPVELKNWELTTWSLQEREKFYFLLDW